MNTAWAAGAVVGPAAGAAIASATGDWIPFLLLATLCGVALFAVHARARGRTLAKVGAPGA